MIGAGATKVLEVDLDRLTKADPPRRFRADWVLIAIEAEGLLGARLREEWYWEPFEWQGLNEPVAGHGVKLILYRLSGSSGANAGETDILWERDTRPVLT
jgi:hypothetical protein